MEISIFNHQIYIRKEILIAASVFAVLVLGIAGYMIKNGGEEVIVDAGQMATATSGQETAGNIEDGQEQKNMEDMKKLEDIKVYVVGCIKEPGVVTLKKGQIIEDAINAAGGATEEADLENINLAYELNENSMIKILSKKETQATVKEQEKQMPGEGDKPSGKAAEGIKIVKDSGGAVVGNVSETGKKAEKGKVNINTAALSELDTLPGVGEKTANDIIAYREKSGGFKKIEDIMNVPRIGESRFNQMKELITVQ